MLACCYNSREPCPQFGLSAASCLSWCQNGALQTGAAAPPADEESGDQSWGLTTGDFDFDKDGEASDDQWGLTTGSVTLMSSSVA